MITGGRLAKSVVVSIALLGLVGLFYPPQVRAESLSRLLARQTELRRAAEESKKKIEQKRQEVNDLQGIVAGLDEDIATTGAEISNTESLISVSEAIIAELVVEIDSTQSQLDDLQLKLRHAYISLYELSQTSAIDSILSSSTLSEIVSQLQYIQSLQSELQANIGKATAAKTELEDKKGQNEAQKSSLVGLKADLNRANTSLNNRRGQKTYLLTQTQGQQAQYEALLKKLESEHAQLSQEIYAERRRLGGGESFFGGTGGYPWAGESNFYAADPWLFYKRQCVSYTAWKFLVTYGQVFYNTRPGQGSAWNWPALARDQGYQTSSVPRVGAIVSWPASSALRMPVGHTAWVESVNNDGTINLSEYNWVIERGYSERHNVNPNRYGTPTYIFP